MRNSEASFVAANDSGWKNACRDLGISYRSARSLSTKSGLTSLKTMKGSSKSASLSPVGQSQDAFQQQDCGEAEKHGHQTEEERPQSAETVGS